MKPPPDKSYTKRPPHIRDGLLFVFLNLLTLPSGTAPTDAASRRDKRKPTTTTRVILSLYRKKMPLAGAFVGDGQAFPARQVLTNEKRRTVAGTDSCGWASRREFYV